MAQTMVRTNSTKDNAASAECGNTSVLTTMAAASSEQRHDGPDLNDALKVDNKPYVKRRSTIAP